MPSLDIDGKGTITNLTDYEFLMTLGRLAEGYKGLARGYVGNQSSGLADFKGTYYLPLMALVERQVSTIEGQIKDKELDDAFRALVSCLRKLSEIDELIVQEQAMLNGVSPTLESQDRIKLERRLKKNRKEFLSRPMTPKLQFLANESMNNWSSAQDAYRRVDDRVRQLLPTSNHSVSQEK